MSTFTNDAHLVSEHVLPSWPVEELDGEREITVAFKELRLNSVSPIVSEENVSFHFAIKQKKDLSIEVKCHKNSQMRKRIANVGL